MNLVIANTQIRRDEEGRYSLNDLHVASGAEKRNGPTYFLDGQQARPLIDALTDTGNPVSVVRGGMAQGSYVAKELVYANHNKAMTDHCKGVAKRYPLLENRLARSTHDRKGGDPIEFNALQLAEQAITQWSEA